MIKYLLKMRKYFFLRLISYYFMKFIGIELPLSVRIGKNLLLPHWAYGLVVHELVEIKDNVKIYQGVTISRKDTYQENKHLNKIIIGNNVIISAGAKVLFEGSGVIEDGCVIGANAVVLINDGKLESGTYVGVPAKKIK